MGHMLLKCFDLIPAWLYNHMPGKIWDGITYLFPNFNGSTVEIWEWISNCTAHIIMDMITNGRYVLYQFRFTCFHIGCISHAYTPVYDLYILRLQNTNVCQHMCIRWSYIVHMYFPIQVCKFFVLCQTLCIKFLTLRSYKKGIMVSMKIKKT